MATQPPLINVISNQEHTALKSLQERGINIIDSEYNRLKQKEDNIISRQQNAERMILLNQTYSERQKQYLILMAIFIITLSISLVIVFVQQRTIEKSAMLDVFLVIVIVIGIVSAYYTYLDILGRDKININSLNMNHVSIQTPESKTAEQKQKLSEGKITEVNQGTCYGSACCTYKDASDYNAQTNDPKTGTFWNAVEKKCVKG
jgi:hypothetical protein